MSAAIPVSRPPKADLARVALVFALAGMVSFTAQAAPSPALAAALTELSAEQKAFINDPAKLRRFSLTREKLYTLLEGRDAQGVKSLVVQMMETLEAAKFQPPQEPWPSTVESEMNPVGGDMPFVPLNPKAGSFNAGVVLRPPALDDYQRDPGVFSLKRYMFETDGIPTFAGAPVALRTEDLVASKVDVAFVGVPLNLGSGGRDAQHAPSILRAAHNLGGYDVYAGLNPAVELTLADYGDLRTDRMSVELSMAHIRKMVGEIASVGVVPFVIGGDHSVMFPTVAAMSDVYGAGEVGILQLDAHHDAQRGLEHLHSDVQSVTRLLEQKLVDGKDLVQIGLRGQDLSEDDLKWLQQQGVHYHTMAQIESRGWQKVFDATLDELRRGPGKVFVSFDISVLDPAYGTAIGRPASSGLTMREVVPLMRRVCAETEVVGFELLDVNPMYDLSYETSLNANYIMHACLTGIAMRKKGLKQAGYLSPLSSK